MYHNIFDSHAHYDDEQFNPDRNELLVSFKENGVSGVVCCGVDVKTSEFAVELSHKYDFVYSAVGFHPLENDEYTDDALERIKELAQDEKCVAIGEIGLDYHYEKENRENQLILLEKQIKLANELDLPIIFHDRESHEDTLNILKKYKPKGVLHCFSGSVEMAKEIAPGTWMQHKDDVMPHLEKANTGFMLGEKLCEIGNGYIVTENIKNKKSGRSSERPVLFSSDIIPFPRGSYWYFPVHPAAHRH